MKTFSKILVPVDFSDASREALRDAMGLAARFDASVVVMHAYEVPVMGLLPEGTLIPSATEAAAISDAAESALKQIVQACERPDVHVDWILREGPAWQQIDAVADEIGADLIVLGTHGRHGVQRVLLGSVAEKVVRTAHQPVLTIRDPGAEHN